MLWEPDKGKKGYWTEQDSWYPPQTPLNSHFLSTASIWSVLTEHLPSWHWLGTGDRNALLELILMKKDRHWIYASGLRAVQGSTGDAWEALQIQTEAGASHPR